MNRTPSPQIHLNMRIIPILVELLLLMELIDPYQGWIILLTGLCGFWGLSYLWARTSARNLQLTREMRFGWAQVGDQLEERFTLQNKTWLPALWVEVRDQSNLPGYKVSQVTGVEGNSMNSWRTHGTCTRRGLFTLGPSGLSTGDPFGVFTVNLFQSASTTLFVMPPVIPLPTIEVAPGGRSGQARPRSDAPERTVSASILREFIPGDSMRWIHWKTSARRDSPFIRIFDGTPTGDWWIVLDLNKNVHLGEGMDSTVEHAIILTASLADRGIRIKRAVGLAVNSENLVWLPPEEGSKRRWDILRALTLVNQGSLTLAELLTRSTSTLAKQASLIIITPDMDLDWVEALIPLLWRGVVPTVLLMDPASWEQSAFPDQGMFHTASLSAKKIQAALEALGVMHYTITRDLLDRPEAHPGREGQWEWRILPTGRAIPVKKPANTAWKALT